jgi:hypothetical protein
MANTIEIPTQLFVKFVRATEAIGNLQEAFEDFLISQNPAILRSLRKARREHLSGNTRPFEEFKRRLNRPRTST